MKRRLEDQDLLSLDVNCPITLNPMKDPVRTIVGSMYSRQAIQAWFESHDTDPLTNVVLSSKELFPVTAIDCALTATQWTQQRLLSNLICSITQDPVKDPVRTMAGNIYSRQAIQTWLGSNHTDPLTNVLLPSKDLFPVTAENVAMTPMQWIRHCNGERFQGAYAALFREWAEPFDEHFALNSVPYSVARLRHMLDHLTEYFMVGIDTKILDNVDRDLGLRRAPHSGSHMECLDLSDLPNKNIKGQSRWCSSSMAWWDPMFSDGDARDGHLKSISFRGTKFPALVMGVSFSGCNLSYTDLRNVVFIHCVFRQNTIFWKAQTNLHTHFVNCVLEHTHGQHCVPLNMDMLRERGLDLRHVEPKTSW